jgi:hypothetical protein
MKNRNHNAVHGGSIKYLVYDRVSGGYVQVKDPEPITLKGWRLWLFTHTSLDDDARFTCSEAISGGALAHGKTRREAIAVAKARLSKNSEEQVLEAIREAVRQPKTSAQISATNTTKRSNHEHI